MTTGRDADQPVPPQEHTGRAGLQPAGPRLYPGVWQALGLLFLAVLLQSALALGFSLWFGDQAGLSRSPMLWGLLNLLALSPVILYGGLRAGGGPDVFPLRPIPAVTILPIVVTVTGLAILLSEADNVTQRLIGPPPDAFDVSWVFEEESHGLMGVIFTLVLVAPLTEELLFRGIILRGFLTRYRMPAAILLTALLFALLHLNPWQFLGALTLGVWFGWLYVQLDSLVPCILGHAVANAMPIIATAAFPAIRGFTRAGEHAQFQPIWLDLTGLALFVAGLAWLLHALPGARGPRTA